MVNSNAQSTNYPDKCWLDDPNRLSLSDYQKAVEDAKYRESVHGDALWYTLSDAVYSVFLVHEKASVIPSYIFHDTGYAAALSFMPKEHFLSIPKLMDSASAVNSILNYAQCEGLSAHSQKSFLLAWIDNDAVDSESVRSGRVIAFCASHSEIAFEFKSYLHRLAFVDGNTNAITCYVAIFGVEDVTDESLAAAFSHSIGNYGALLSLCSESYFDRLDRIQLSVLETVQDHFLRGGEAWQTACYSMSVYDKGFSDARAFVINISKYRSVGSCLQARLAYAVESGLFQILAKVVYRRRTDVFLIKKLDWYFGGRES